MKILFVENRYKTFLYEPVAQILEKENHEIHWLVQNKIFLPKKRNNIHILKYPKTKKNYKKKNTTGIIDAIISDRQINNFGVHSNSYFYYYYDEIEKVINKINPDLVFGESTVFHELLTLSICRVKNILYLNPSTSRYPVGRFSFYKYDTLEPFAGSNVLLSDDKALRIINQIIHRNTIPDYMKLSPPTKNQMVKDKFKKIYSYFSGEKFNTPNPSIKYKKEKEKQYYITQWDKNAIKEISHKAKVIKILYPLQMQPEANIDVWGRKYRNQTDLVDKLASNLPKGCVLFVKPNPKSNYELNEKLIRLVESHNNIQHLNHSTKMDNILPFIDLVFTVTGTIAIECILSNKPIVTLIETLNNSVPNCKYIENFDETLSSIIRQVKKNTFTKISIPEKIDFINLLNKKSYKGIISDPFTDSNCVKTNNINDLAVAFKDVINSYAINK